MDGDGRLTIDEIREQVGDSKELSKLIKTCKIFDTEGNGFDTKEWEQCKNAHGITTKMMYKWHTHKEQIEQAEEQHTKSMKQAEEQHNSTMFWMWVGMFWTAVCMLIPLVYSSITHKEALKKQKEQHDESIDVSKKQHVVSNEQHAEALKEQKEQHDEALKKQKEQHDAALAQEREIAAKVVLFELDKCIMDKAIHYVSDQHAFYKTTELPPIQIYSFFFFFL